MPQRKRLAYSEYLAGRQDVVLSGLTMHARIPSGLQEGGSSWYLAACISYDEEMRWASAREDEMSPAFSDQNQSESSMASMQWHHHL